MGGTDPVTPPPLSAEQLRFIRAAADEASSDVGRLLATIDYIRAEFERENATAGRLFQALTHDGAESTEQEG